MDVFIQPNHITSFAEPRNLFGQRIGHLSLKDLWPENETLLNSHPPQKKCQIHQIYQILLKKKLSEDPDLYILSILKRTQLSTQNFTNLMDALRARLLLPLCQNLSRCSCVMDDLAMESRVMDDPKKSLRYQFFTVEPPEVVST